MSPSLPHLTSKERTINDVPYPTDSEILSSDVLEDWIVRVEDALIDVRNGVTAIAWPLALAGFIGFVAMTADIVEEALSITTAISDHPFKTSVAVFLLLATIGAFKITDQSTKNRRNLVTIRSSYLRRRRALGRQNPETTTPGGSRTTPR